MTSNDKMTSMDELTWEKELVQWEIIRLSNEFKSCKKGPLCELMIARELATLTLKLTFLLRKGAGSGRLN
ncbi:hypothetical protein [Mucilaginibacter agri]|uniref:Uncharacterized protein n=1 Tax=Mucilaginibacter agri TaxID=2695265 RepID=A0A966DSI1_9SPHI|nr:hypothetical protein [Mucilaginibacter agri]NCD70163.1 hypothetical protein [Mucilaginibacter agri]